MHIHGVGFTVNIHENRPGAGVTNGRDSGNESEGNGDDFIAGSDIGREQCQVQGARAGVESYPETSIAVGGELFLKGGDFVTQNELAALQH